MDQPLAIAMPAGYNPLHVGLGLGALIAVAVVATVRFLNRPTHPPRRLTGWFRHSQGLGRLPVPVWGLVTDLSALPTQRWARRRLRGTAFTVLFAQLGEGRYRAYLLPSGQVDALPWTGRAQIKRDSLGRAYLWDEHHGQVLDGLASAVTNWASLLSQGPATEGPPESAARCDDSHQTGRGQP